MWRLSKISIMPTVHENLFVLRNISIVGITKSNVLVIVFIVFMWPLSLMNVIPIRIIYLQCFEMVYKKTRSYYIGMMNDGIPSSSSDSEITSKENKNRRATFKIQMKIHCLSLKSEDDALFKDRFKKTCLCTKFMKGHAKK